VIDRLVLFGSTGDLAGRFVLPGLAALHAAGHLPAAFRIVGAAREELDGDAFRRHAASRLEEHAADTPPASRQAIVRSLHYRPVDVADHKSVAAVIRAVETTSDTPFAAYLALPPALFERTVTALGAVGLPKGSRVVLEKPFGRNAADAAALNALLARTTASAGPGAAYRVDHVLGMDTVHNLVGLRLADPVLAAVWDGTHIDHVEVLWEETLALEGRAGYYDTAGALQDVVQNHLLQLLSLVAMEPPAPSGRPDLHDRQIEVLRKLRPITDEDIASRTRRARYTAGTLADNGGAAGNTVPDYVDEDGVDPSRQTETFAEVSFEIDSDRWNGTRFTLRAGKALRERRKGVGVRFRRPGNPSPTSVAGQAVTGRLWIGIDGPNELSLTLVGLAPGPTSRVQPLTLVSPPPVAALPPYANVLLDILRGGDDLSVRGDVAEEAWRVIDPIVNGWRREKPPLETYPADSDGPPPRTRRLSR
jgi:glucose-6-phosphate 1-dehydrogenase